MILLGWLAVGAVLAPCVGLALERRRRRDYPRPAIVGQALDSRRKSG